MPNYKKTLCKAFDESGMCQWNMTCMFAHGRGELRYVLHGILYCRLYLDF